MWLWRENSPLGKFIINEIFQSLKNENDGLAQMDVHKKYNSIYFIYFVYIIYFYLFLYIFYFFINIYKYPYKKEVY